MAVNNAAIVLSCFFAFPANAQSSDEFKDYYSAHIPQHDNSKVIYWAEICFVNDFLADGRLYCTV